MQAQLFADKRGFEQGDIPVRYPVTDRGGALLCCVEQHLYRFLYVLHLPLGVGLELLSAEVLTGAELQRLLTERTAEGGER